MTLPLFVIHLPVRTRNPLNGSRGNSVIAHVIRQRERAAHRDLAWLKTTAEMHRMRVSSADVVPCVVTLVRVSAGKMDDDGLAASFKGVRDGVAKALGVDDGSPMIRFAYEQRRCARNEFGVEVHVARGPSADVVVRSAPRRKKR